MSMFLPLLQTVYNLEMLQVSGFIEKGITSGNFKLLSFSVVSPLFVAVRLHQDACQELSPLLLFGTTLNSAVVLSAIKCGDC